MAAWRINGLVSLVTDNRNLCLRRAKGGKPFSHRRMSFQICIFYLVYHNLFGWFKNWLTLAVCSEEYLSVWFDTFLLKSAFPWLRINNVNWIYYIWVFLPNLPFSYVMMMPFKRQALVEFENIDSAKECVTFAADEPVYIAGQQAFFNYSTSKRITRPGNTDDPSGGNKVLLLSIQNPLYPITVVCILL